MKQKVIQMAAAMLSILLLLSACSTGTSSTAKGDEYTIPDYEDGLRYQPEWTRDAVIYEVNVRQYTPEGTFNAFAEHLEELKDMGINTLWFMPIHPISKTLRSGTLGSYYAATDYREVNPEFGMAEDFKALVDWAHEMGFKVMLDWVDNHTGWDSPWIAGHPDWYIQDESGNIISPLGMGWPDVADLNFDNADMRAEMIACMKYWIEEYDIDGYRCDHAGGVPVDFWEEARAELEAVKPMFMLAEDDASVSLLTSAFDFNYNLKLYDTLVAVAKDAKRANSVKYYIPESYPDGTYTLNYLDNHDKNSYDNTIMSAFGADTIPAMFSLIYTIPGVQYQFYLVCDDVIYFYTQKGVTTYVPDHTYDFVLLADYVQPAWVKEDVFYQIFPERFCNGDPSNDVQTGEYSLYGHPALKAADWEMEPPESLRRYLLPDQRQPRRPGLLQGCGQDGPAGHMAL